MIIRRFAAVLLLMSASTACIAQEKTLPPSEPAPAAQQQPAKPAKPTPAPAAQQQQPAKPAKPAKRPPALKRSTRFDMELTGITTETTDQVYSRLIYNRRFGPEQWSVKAGYGATVTRTYSKNRENKTEIDTTTLDAQYRRDRGVTYNFISAAAYIRNRSPFTVTYGDVSGYYMISGGVGRKLLPGLEGEFALADVQRYGRDAGRQIQPCYTFRLRTPLSDALMLDGESNFIEPFSQDTIVDSRLNLTYKFTPSLSMRLTYIANNLLPIQNARTEWDKSFRISLVFSRATP